MWSGILGPLKHFEQLGFVGMESFEQAVERDVSMITFFDKSCVLRF